MTVEFLSLFKVYISGEIAPIGPNFVTAAFVVLCYIFPAKTVVDSMLLACEGEFRAMI